MAILEYEKAIKFDSTQIGVWKEISDMYAEKGDNKKAVEAYQTYMNLLPADKPNAEAMLQLGKLYYTYGSEATTTPEIKKDVLVKADTLFSKVAALEPANYRGNFWRARANFSLESEATPALGKPFYEQTLALVESKADARFNSVIIECSRYLGYYYYMKSDYTQSKIYWNKILVIEPTNPLAIQAIEGMNKPAKPAKK